MRSDIQYIYCLLEFVRCVYNQGFRSLRPVLNRVFMPAIGPACSERERDALYSAVSVNSRARCRTNFNFQDNHSSKIGNEKNVKILKCIESRILRPPWPRPLILDAARGPALSPCSRAWWEERRKDLRFADAPAAKRATFITKFVLRGERETYITELVLTFICIVYWNSYAV
jgi:hypothetical protein